MKHTDPQVMSTLGGILLDAASQITELQEALRIEKEAHETALSGWRTNHSASCAKDEEIDRLTRKLKATEDLLQVNINMRETAEANAKIAQGSIDGQRVRLNELMDSLEKVTKRCRAANALCEEAVKGNNEAVLENRELKKTVRSLRSKVTYWKGRANR